MSTGAIIAIGMLLGVVVVFGFLIVLHDRFGLPIPTVDWAIIIYASILFIIGVGLGT